MNIKTKLQVKKKIFDSDFVAICKSKVTSMLHKTAYVGMCILNLSIDVQVPL